MRTFDLDIVVRATLPYAHELLGFYPDTWLEDEKNVALTNNDGDVFLLERSTEKDNMVNAHYFFLTRGRKALEAGKEFVKETFEGPYNIEVIRGLSPLQKLGARWMNRQLGATSYGVVQTFNGPCELVILTKDEWLRSHNLERMNRKENG